MMMTSAVRVSASYFASARESRLRQFCDSGVQCKIFYTKALDSLHLHSIASRVSKEEALDLSHSDLDT